jgi:hypothetical protein
MQKPPNKVNLIKCLDYISEAMKTGRPKTTKLRNNKLLPEGMVIKRTHSDCGTHVFIPGEDESMT